MEGASPAGLLEITPQAEEGNETVLVVLFGRHLATLGFYKPMMETEAPGIYKKHVVVLPCSAPTSISFLFSSDSPT